MRILRVKSADALNGPGIRASIWVAGCTNNCKGCWAQDTWDPHQGKEYNEVRDLIRKVVSNPNLDGISLLGGDPFYWGVEDNDGELLEMLKLIKEESPSKSIWCWTGYTYGFLSKNEYCRECLKYIDTLVEGRFVLGERDLTLKFRGSRNQRIIHNLSNTNESFSINKSDSSVKPKEGMVRLSK